MAQLNFKTNIQLKSIIGKDLINDDKIAILELVKNSFDADAKRVDIFFKNLKKNDDKTIETFSSDTSRIIIKDNGLGMDLNDIQNKWLNIAYSEKKLNTRQHNRMMAGAKGVGRFSCDRLGEYLNLYAKKLDSDKYILLKIDWKKFEVEDENKEIQSIQLEYETLSAEQLKERNIETFERGVLLEIIKLRSNWVYQNKDPRTELVTWNTDKLVGLKKYLEKLINPNQAFEKNDFGIFLNASEFILENQQKEEHQKFIGKIENTIFEKLDFKTTSIECEIIESGKVILTTLKDKGQTIFWLKETNTFYPSIKNVKIFLYYLNTFSKAFFTKQTGVRPVAYGSIYLFINGFRVTPYGDEGDDWLNLEQRKSQGYARFLGTRDLVGRIEILDDYNDFPIVSSREGIKKNDNYKELTDREGFFFKAFKRLERYVVDGLSWDSIPEEINISELEKKIISGQTKEDELTYRETDDAKKSRVYQSIHSIIAARPDNVVELYINEDLILQKIEVEKETAEKEFEQLISDFENKKVDPVTINRILQRKAIENKELEKQIADLSRYTTSDATTKAILELQQYKDKIEKQARIIEELNKQLAQSVFESTTKQSVIDQLKADLIQKEQSVLEEKQRTLEETLKRVKAEQERDIEKQQNRYLIATRPVSNEVMDVIHAIKISAQDMSASMNAIFNIIESNSIKNHSLIKELEFLKFNIDKSKLLSEFITKADLNDLKQRTWIDIPQYINEYIQNYNHRPGSIFRITCSQEVPSFRSQISILDLSIILDNLISNSKKAGATQINIAFGINENQRLQVDISDNGAGLSKSYQDNPSSIFKLGITDKSGGSGIGLHTLKEIMRDHLHGDIEYIGNGIPPQGATFRLIIK